VTIAKALRNPKSYWEELFEAIEPAARVFEQANNVAMEDFLLREELFLGLANESRPIELDAITPQGASEGYDEYKGAVGKLQEEWFCFCRRTREACLANVEMDRVETVTAVQAEKK
jgi:hypothetical protein